MHEKIFLKPYKKNLMQILIKLLSQNCQKHFHSLKINFFFFLRKKKVLLQSVKKNSEKSKSL